MKDDFRNAIEQRLTETLIQKAAQLPKNFNQTKFIQNCLTALDSTKDIENIDEATIVKGLMKGAVLGLDFMNQECYLIAYKNNKKGGVYEMNFQTHYKGEKKLAMLYSVKPIKEITTELVRQGDFYEYKVENNKKVINWTPQRFNDGEVEGGFSIVLFEDDSSVSVEMSVSEIEQIKNTYSKAKDSPAWKDRPTEMQKKTILRSNLKNIEKSFESPEQLRAYEDASDFEFNKNSNLVTAPGPVVKNLFENKTQPKQIEAKSVETVTIEEQKETVPANAERPKTNENTSADVFYCSDCGKAISWAENQFSVKKFKAPLCRDCQAARRGNK